MASPRTSRRDLQAASGHPGEKGKLGSRETSAGTRQRSPDLA